MLFKVVNDHHLGSAVQRGLAHVYIVSYERTYAEGSTAYLPMHVHIQNTKYVKVGMYINMYA
jgi:hypothetical protein